MIPHLPRCSLHVLCASLALLALGCSDEREFEPRLELDGPTLRSQIQRKALAPRAASPVEKDYGDAESKDLAGGGFSGDLGRIPFTSAAKLASDAELWPEETFALELTGDQLLLLRRIVAGDVGREAYGRLFAPDARLATPATALGEAGPIALGVTRSPWAAGAGAELDLDAWSRALALWQATFARLRWATFVPSFVAFEGERARVEVDWQIDVELAGGGIRHDRGTWTSEWVRSGDAAGDARPRSSRGWLCTKLEPVSGVTYSTAAVAFVDVTEESLAGTSFSPLLPRADEEKEHYRGIALADVDGDDDLDLVASIPNSLLLNDGEGRFEDVSERAGIARDRGYTGVQAADFDRDGDVDLVFTGKRCYALFYAQVEPGRFEATPISVSRADNFPASLTAHDVDEDGWLDLFICGYGPLVNPGPNEIDNATNARNNQMLRGGPNGFSDVTEAWGLWREGTRWTFIGAFGDADEDGDTDLYAANDFGPNVLYRRVRRSPPLFEPEVEPKDAISPSFSMSATWADLDGDLDLDMYVSNMESVEVRRIERLPGHAASEPWERDVRELMSNGNTVLLQEERAGGRVLVEAPDSAGARDGKWAWGTAIFDWENDGDLDIQCVNGFRSIGIDDGRDWDSVWWRYSLGDMRKDPALWVESLMEHFPKSGQHGWSWAGHQRNVFYVNDGSAHFEQLAPVLGLDQIADGRALAMGDLDRDGDYDLVGSNVNSPHVNVLRNDTQGTGRFAWVELVPAERRSAAGAQIRLTAGGRTQRRDVALGEGFLAQHELGKHFGLGAAERIERIEVTWPDGASTLLEDLPVDRRFRIAQGVAGFEELPLRPRNYNATGRMGAVEWSNDAQQLELVDEALGADLSAALAAGVVPSPLGLPSGDASLGNSTPPHDALPAPGERGTNASGEGGANSGETIRAVVLWDPARPRAREKLAPLAELVGLAALEVVLVSPIGAEPPELPAGLAATHATYASEEGRAALHLALRRWCGTHDLPWPVVLYCSGERVQALSRGAIVPARVRALCEQR